MHRGRFGGGGLSGARRIRAGQRAELAAVGQHLAGQPGIGLDQADRVEQDVRGFVELDVLRLLGILLFLQLALQAALVRVQAVVQRVAGVDQRSIAAIDGQVPGAEVGLDLFLLLALRLQPGGFAQLRPIAAIGEEPRQRGGASGRVVRRKQDSRLPVRDEFAVRVPSYPA